MLRITSVQLLASGGRAKVQGDGNVLLQDVVKDKSFIIEHPWRSKVNILPEDRKRFKLVDPRAQPMMSA